MLSSSFKLILFPNRFLTYCAVNYRDFLFLFVRRFEFSIPLFVLSRLVCSIRVIRPRTLVLDENSGQEGNYADSPTCRVHPAVIMLKSRRHLCRLAEILPSAYPVAVYMLKTTVEPSSMGPSPIGTNAAYKNDNMMLYLWMTRRVINKSHLQSLRENET